MQTRYCVFGLGVANYDAWIFIIFRRYETIFYNYGVDYIWNIVGT